MLCSKCGFESPDDARFCAGCGDQFPEICGQCKTPLLPEAQFCHQCGAALTKNTLPDISESVTKISPERRQLTIMFCDLANSTALSQEMDTEDWRELLRDFQQTSSTIIDRYEGYISRFMGDGILVFFGYPLAHENDPDRAVLAALEIVEAIEKLNDKYSNISHRLNVRIGIATGQVIAGDLIGKGSAEEKAVVGETPNLAARLQSAASPGSVLISEATWNLLNYRFSATPCEPLRLKGFSSPVVAFLVTDQAEIEKPGHTKNSTTKFNLIGREDELNLLGNAWQNSSQGEGVVILLSAEAGIGKSTIVRELREQVGTEHANHLLYYCSPFHKNSSWYPIRENMERILRFDKNDDTNQRYNKIDNFVANFKDLPGDIISTIATLFSLPDTNTFSSPQLSPQELKHRLMQYLVLVVEKLAAQQPQLMIFEDAHWMDPTTIEFISMQIDRLANSPVMMVITYRPEFESPWVNQPNVRLLNLNRLNRSESMVMIGKIINDCSLPENVLERILAKTDGIPLYIEEFTRALLESDQLSLTERGYELKGQLSPLAVPSSLQDSLVSRLDGLSQAKELAQLASVLGRRFDYKLLRLACGKSEAEMAQGIEELKNAGILFEHGIEPEIQFQFKHALLQDAAYQSLLRTQRQKLHWRVAQAFLQHLPDVAEQQSSIIAHHLTEADKIQDALPYWLKAGYQSASQFANVEAIAHLNRGLELIKQLPDTHERDLQEMEFHLVLGPALMATRGFAVSEVEQAYERCRELCAKVGTDRQQFTATWGLWLYRQQHGQISEARKLASVLLQSPSRDIDKGLNLQAHHAAWTTAFRIGDFATCCSNAENGISLYQQDQHHQMVLEFGGHDAGVCGFYHAAQSRWVLGYPDQALSHVSRSQLLANEIDHPFSMASHLNFASFIYQYVGFVDDVLRMAETLQQIHHDYSVAPQYQKTTWVLLGWVKFQQGKVEDGLEQMQSGLDIISRSPTRAHETYLLAVLAEAYLQCGRVEECSATLERAFKNIDESGELTWKAEIHRLAAVHAFATSKPTDQVDAHFTQALKLARDCNARSFELRCAISQVECSQADTRTKIIRDHLQPVYKTFSEGFATADLKKSALLINSIN